ncbi:hypothetical protein QE152_g35929 [Popillia japonica]|uniref:Uncharacterized protein n=1 Tax=Popillia japonica TaxID=7064 RepID=A0AAW1IEE6_POPJA
MLTKRQLRLQNHGLLMNYSIGRLIENILLLIPDEGPQIWMDAKTASVEHPWNSAERRIPCQAGTVLRILDKNKSPLARKRK